MKKYQGAGTVEDLLKPIKPGDLISSDNTVVRLNTLKGPINLSTPQTKTKLKDTSAILNDMKKSRKKIRDSRKTRLKIANNAAKYGTFKQSLLNSAAGDYFNFSGTEEESYINPLSIIGSFGDKLNRAFLSRDATLGDKASSIINPLAMTFAPAKVAAPLLVGSDLIESDKPSEEDMSEYYKAMLELDPKFFIKKKKGGNINKLGYLDNSPYRYNPYNIINTPNGLITMNGVSTPLMAFSELGESKYMPPNSGLHKFGGNRILEIPVAQNGGNLPCLECGGNLKKYQDAGSFYKDKKDKIDYLNNISNLYKSLSIGSSAIPYMRSDRTSILNDGVPLDTEHNTCIDVVTGIIKKCGKNLQKRYLDNTDFSDNVTKGSEDAYRVNGNFQLGDIVQAQTQVYPRNGDPNKKYYKPFDSKIIMDIENKNSDDPIYVAVGSSGGSKITKTYYPLSQLKELIGNQERLVTRFGKALDKDKRASSDPEILEIINNKKSLIDYDANNPTLYNYSILENAPNYDKYTKPIIDKFINFANDPKNISTLVRSTGRTSEEVQDALLNVFGILGQESNFGAYGKGKGFNLGAFWRNVKNGMEETLTAFPGKSGESYSVGPGQIKFKYLPENLRKKYNIGTPDDLYDVEKIIPLMVEMDLDNRKTLENLGERSELSKALINKESDLKAEDLEFGVGRWSPYLRNQYNSVVGNNKKTRGTHLVNNTDWIPFNTERVTNDYKLDPGSYPRKVMDFWRNNLSRKLQQYHGNDINGDPITSDLSEYDIQNKDLPPIILNSTSSKKLPIKQPGGAVRRNNLNFVNDYTITDPKNKNKKYPLDSKKIQQVISTSIGMNYDPKMALALALQETGIGRTDDNIFHIISRKFDKEPIELTGNPIEDGINIVKYKKKYANSLGFNSPELELQTFNGLGKVFRNTERRYHGFDMDKIYGVPIPKEGIDMKKNPLYGKRVIQLKNDIIDKDPYINKLIDYYADFYNNPDSVYYTKNSELPNVVISNKDLPFLAFNSTLPKLSKKQDGGRLVDNVPEGYLPLPNKPNYFYKTTNKDVLSQDNLAGQKASSEEWNKFLNSPKGKVWKENQQNTDIVYIQPNQPVKSFDGQLIYKLDNKPAGMYRWKTRDGKILSSNNGQLNDNLVEWSDVDMYGKPTGNILTIPGDVFSNKITKGVNRLYDENLLNTYRTPSLKKGGSLKRYQGPGTSFIGPRPQNWLASLNMYDTDIKPELWKEASSLNNTEFEKESPVKVPSNLLLKDGESLEQREARLNKKDSDFDYWGTGLNTILAANGLLRWASNNKVEGEKYQNYLNQVHDDDSFNTVYSNMSKDYGNDSYRTLRKGGKLKKYQDGGDDSYDEEDDEVISLLFDDKEESSSSEKNKITESDINNQRKLLKKERKKLLEQQEEIENNTIINEIISQQSRKSNYYGEEEGGGGNFPSSSLEKAQVYKNYLIENHGLSNEQASGFLGNLYAESSLNPSIINPTSGAFGLAQWLGSRKKSLLKFAKDNGKDVNDPFLQLDFAVRELNTTHKNSHLDYNSPKSATVGYLNKFEKPSEEEKRKSFAKRVNFANSIYQQGGTYDLSLDEVQSLINQGYKIKHL